MHALYLIGSLLLLFAGLYEYTSGFFLTRYEIKIKATRHPLQPQAQYEKVIILLVDALRNDFVFPSDQEKVYTNKLKNVKYLLETQPEHSVIMNFISDPPTMTHLRVKSILTGALPTFIDFKDNIQSDEIQEDNIIYQLGAINKTSIFVGDTVWIELLPNSFIRTYPYNPHNVRDLDTVDSGVRKYFREEMNKDWNIMIGHMLGVDHVGHRYDANHPEMSRKLLEVNDFIGELVQNMTESTLLLVFGDHGMSESGNHGGATPEEVSSVLFAYSKKPFALPISKRRPSVSQIDIVPTISLLLGAAIPLNNLGTLIPELFINHSAIDISSFINAQQISTYLNLYDQNIKKLPDSVYERIQSYYFSIEKDFNEGRIDREKNAQFIQRAGEMCRDIWVNFDTWHMAIGALAVVVITIAVIFSMLFHVDFTGISWQILVSFLLVFISPAVSGVFWLGCTVKRVLKWTFDDGLGFAFAIYCVYGYSLFSDSYIVKGDQTVRFLLQGLLAYVYLKKMSYELLICSICIRISAVIDINTMIEEKISENILYNDIFLSHIPLAVIIYFSKPLSKFSLVLVWIYWNIFEGTIQIIPRIVYLLTLLSPFFQKTRWNFVPVFVILSGSSSPIIFLCALIQMYTGSKAITQSSVFGVFMCFSCMQYFYATGHHYNIQSLIISSSFIGFDEYNLIIATILLTLNTLTSYFLLLFANKLHNRNKAIQYAMIGFLVSMSCSVLNTLVNRRHLRVWAIFAPKYLFEVIIFGATWLICIFLITLKREKEKGSV